MTTKTKESKGKIRQFRLISDKGPAGSRMGNAGPHYEPNPEFDPDEPESEDNVRSFEYLPGEVVKSSRDLCKIFPNKFIPLGDAGDRSYAQSPGGDSLPYDEDPDADRPVTSTEDALVRRGERHLTPDDLDGKEHQKKLVKGKKVKSQKEEDEDEEEESSESESEEDSEKEDVTNQFEEASDAGMQVFKVGDKYHVHEEGEDDPMRGSKKGFTTKTRVKKFIRENTKDEGDEDEE